MVRKVQGISFPLGAFLQKSLKDKEVSLCEVGGQFQVISCRDQPKTWWVRFRNWFVRYFTQSAREKELMWCARVKFRETMADRYQREIGKYVCRKIDTTDFTNYRPLTSHVIEKAVKDAEAIVTNPVVGREIDLWIAASTGCPLDSSNKMVNCQRRELALVIGNRLLEEYRESGRHAKGSLHFQIFMNRSRTKIREILTEDLVKKNQIPPAEIYQAAWNEVLKMGPVRLPPGLILEISEKVQEEAQKNGEKVDLLHSEKIKQAIKILVKTGGETALDLMLGVIDEGLNKKSDRSCVASQFWEEWMRGVLYRVQQAGDGALRLSVEDKRRVLMSVMEKKEKFQKAFCAYLEGNVVLSL